VYAQRAIIDKRRIIDCIVLKYNSFITDLLRKTNWYVILHVKFSKLSDSEAFNSQVLDPLIGWLKSSRHQSKQFAVSHVSFFFAAILPSNKPVYFKIDTDVNWRPVDFGLRPFPALQLPHFISADDLPLHATFDLRYLASRYVFFSPCGECGIRGFSSR